jgi:hypothetical protein
MAIPLSAFGGDATCLPDVVSEHYGMDDLKMELTIKRSICEKGGIIKSFDIKINGDELSIPGNTYNDVLFSFRIPFGVSYLSPASSQEGSAFVISTEATHVLVSNE